MSGIQCMCGGRFTITENRLGKFRVYCSSCRTGQTGLGSTIEALNVCHAIVKRDRAMVDRITNETKEVNRG